MCQGEYMIEAGKCIPWRAVRLKQKAGVSFGAGVVVGAAMTGTRTGGAGDGGGDGAGDGGLVFQKYSASLNTTILFAFVQCIKIQEEEEGMMHA